MADTDQSTLTLAGESAQDTQEALVGEMGETSAAIDAPVVIQIKEHNMSDYEERLRQAHALKRPFNAFILFQTETRGKLRPEPTEPGQKVQTNGSIIVREAWANLPAEEKQQYHNRFQQELAEYNQKLAELGFDPRQKLPPLPVAQPAVPLGSSRRAAKARARGLAAREDAASGGASGQPETDAAGQTEGAAGTATGSSGTTEGGDGEQAPKMGSSMFPVTRVRSLMSLALRIGNLPHIPIENLKQVVDEELIPVCEEADTWTFVKTRGGSSSSSSGETGANAESTAVDGEMGGAQPMEDMSADTTTADDENAMTTNGAIAGGDASSSSETQFTSKLVRSYVENTDGFRFGSHASLEALSMVTKAAELFAQWAGRHVGRITQLNGRANVTKEDVEQLIAMSPALQFARATLSAEPGPEPIPPQPAEEKVWKPRSKKLPEIDPSAYEGIGSGSVWDFPSLYGKLEGKGASKVRRGAKAAAGDAGDSSSTPTEKPRAPRKPKATPAMTSGAEISAAEAGLSADVTSIGQDFTMTAESQ